MRSEVRMATEKVSRLEVRAVACPACGAGPEERCAGARGQARERNHLSRVDAARTARSEDPDALAAPLLKGSVTDRGLVVAPASPAAAEDEWLGVTCPRGTCSAPPGQRCRDRGGLSRPRPHASRIRRAAALRENAEAEEL